MVDVFFPLSHIWLTFVLFCSIFRRRTGKWEVIVHFVRAFNCNSNDNGSLAATINGRAATTMTALLLQQNQTGELQQHHRRAATAIHR